LKLELPQLGARLGLSDHALYTDCDVMFCGDVVAELSLSNAAILRSRANSMQTTTAK